MTTKELFDLNLKEIKINKKIKTKYINTLEEQIESDILLEKLTQEQKKKSAEEVSKFYLEPIRVLKAYLDKKWNKKITEEEIKQKRLEYLRYNTIVKKLIDEFKEVGDEEDSKEFVKSITGMTNGWIVRTDDGFKVMPPIYGKEISIIKVPTYSKKLGSFDFEFNKKADKKDIANLSYRHELGHIFNYLKQYIETGKGDIVGTIDALKNGEYEKLVDSEGKANAYVVDNMNRFKRRELLKNSELSNEKLQDSKKKFEEGNIEKLSQLYQAGTEKYSEKIKNTLKGVGK
jgi:hypothetical protein